MKNVKDYVNWSAVARSAFEAKLAEITSEEEIQDMNEVVNRLRRFRRQTERPDNAFTEGFEIGRRWAMSQAAPDQLQRIELFRDSVSDSQWHSLFQDEVSPSCGWRRVAYAIDPSSDPQGGARRMQAKYVMRRILDQSKVDDLNFFRGFAEGALEIWRAVKSQL
jgi:hypothetical protein